VTARRVARFDHAWLDWRFANAPRTYTLLSGDGRAVVGQWGRLGFIAALTGDLLADACAAARGVGVLAIPPPLEHRRYLRAGFIPTPKTFTLLGKSLDGSPLPEHPHLEFGDLDFV
jgi:hypothetical protein